MNITQRLRRALQINPQGIAILEGERKLSWGDVGERVSRFAGALREHGIAKGDRVAVLMLNSSRYLELYLAVGWAGAVIVPLNVRWGVAENCDALQDCSTDFLVVDDMFLEAGNALRTAIPSLALIYAGEGDQPADCASYMLSHGNLMASALLLLAEGAFPRNAVYLHAAPMFHLANGSAMYCMLLNAGTNAIIKTFSPEAVAQAIEDFRVSHTLLVPTMIQMLVDHPGIDGRDFSSLREIMYGASPMSEAVLDRAMVRLPGVRFRQGYGMTELSPLGTLLPPEEHVGAGRTKGRHRSAGRVAVGLEAKIVDANDEPVPRGTVGEIAIRGDVVMMGYWNKPEETAKAVIDSWMHTGDGGYMDEDGYVYVVDRIKDMIITGGENVYSIEVENVIAQHSAVLQCAVIGIPDSQWGEAIHAFVVVRPGTKLEASDLIAFCRDRVGNYKCPRSVDVHTDPLPMSGAGKILKRELRRPFWEKQKREVA
jgi:long-chain acyl-CoA synthetase